MRKTAVIAAVSCLMWSGIASAGEPGWPVGDSAAVNGWEPEVKLFVTTDVFGFEPGKIVSRGGENPIDGSTLRPAAAEVRSRIAARGRWLHLELQVYTQIPNNVLMVSTAGLEAWFLAPVLNQVRVGFYHNSAHNFSDGQFGGGTDVNALVLDSLVLSRRFRLLDDDLQLRVLADSYYMLKGMASPYAITPQTQVLRSDIGDMRWRSSTLVQALHPLGQVQLQFSLYGGENWAPASMLVTASVGYRPGKRFFGVVGDHLTAGPYVTYRRNFSRTADFGVDTYTFGLLFELTVADGQK